MDVDGRYIELVSIWFLNQVEKWLSAPLCKDDFPANHVWLPEDLIFFFKWGYSAKSLELVPSSNVLISVDQISSVTCAKSLLHRLIFGLTNGASSMLIHFAFGRAEIRSQRCHISSCWDLAWGLLQPIPTLQSLSA